MASGKSIYLEQAILNALLPDPPGFLPSLNPTVYLALSTAVFSSTADLGSFSEVTAGDYTRKAVARATAFLSATGGNPSAITNAVDLAWAAATNSWGTVRSVYMVIPSAGTGNWLYGGDLTTARTVAIGDSVRFSTGQLSFREN